MNICNIFFIFYLPSNAKNIQKGKNHPGYIIEKIQQDKKRVDEIIKSTVPMNRFATPQEIADSAVFLCSDRANFITGATLVIDGGQTVGVF